MAPSMRDAGEQALAAARDEVRRQARHALGVRGRPPASCDDSALAYLPVDGAARRIHGDLPGMLIGGVASLLLQLLHPQVMAGVADHSRYREDPFGRLARTAQFVGVTTYGARTDAAAAIHRVRSLHERVVGTDDRGRPYRATDPELLRWVHLTEVAMFLAGARRYGPWPVPAALADQYVGEMATVARDLGVPDPPTTERALDRQIQSARPALRLTTEGRATRDFLLRGVNRDPLRAATYATMATAAVGLVPGWARTQLELSAAPRLAATVVRPAATALTTALRLVVPPRPL